MRTVIIVFILTICFSLSAQFEYELVSSIPSDYERVDYFDFDNDGIEEVVTLSDSIFYVYNVAMQLQQTYNTADFMQYFPAGVDTTSAWDISNGTYFFRWQGNICVAVIYSVII
ncbi:MAG: hypothetical protein K8S56_06405, partial [Candidatus Cloacimonetes bacterium]|nr:hypothetical protein [Candidatus Cloacimonadota bacterium]